MNGVVIKESRFVMRSLYSRATFSECMKYRYTLTRVWDETKPLAVFCMMNPSTATESQNDPTVERCQRRAEQWDNRGHGVGGIIVVNAFAWRETDSKKLPELIISGTDIIGPMNDQAILSASRGAFIVVCAWGKPGNLLSRGKDVLALLRASGVQPYALQINADGSPKHPLYVGYGIEPQPM